MPAPRLGAILALGPDFLKPEWWFDLAGSAALPVVTAIIFAESGLLFGFFLPGDSLLFFTGFLTSSAAKEEAPFNEFAEHIPALAVVLICLTVAAIVGDQVGYLFGRQVGPSLFKRPNSRLFKAENVAKAHLFFERHGPKSIVLARFVPIVRTFTPIVAGIANMRYRTFVTYNVIGGLLWAVGITTLGHFLGEIAFFRDNIEYAIVAIVAISFIPIALEVYRHHHHRRRGDDASDELLAADPAVATPSDLAASRQKNAEPRSAARGSIRPPLRRPRRSCP